MYIDAILELYGMRDAKPVATTGTVTINKTVPDTPLSPEELLLANCYGWHWFEVILHMRRRS